MSGEEALRRRDAGPAPIPGVLERILHSTRAQVDRRRAALPLQALRDSAVTRVGPWGREHRFVGALRRPGIGVIAEYKRRSPSAGAIREGASVTEVVAAFERGGAAALSVLTEELHFGGSLEDLRAARAASDLPILRKDFIVDPYQLHEASAAGADAVLLIVAALTRGELAQLNGAALELGLDVLVEVHDRRELERALELGPQLIGINNRDLRDFTVDVDRTAALLEHVPRGVSVVSESGIVATRQLRELAGAGVDAVLVGESLMRAEDPEAALRGLLDGADTF